MIYRHNKTNWQRACHPLWFCLCISRNHWD